MADGAWGTLHSGWFGCALDRALIVGRLLGDRWALAIGSINNRG